MDAFLRMIPVEVAELIISYLCLPDIRSLRLVNREARYKASGAEFGRYCTTKNVDLRAANLRSMVELIIPESVASRLEHLTLTGIIYVDNGLQRVLRCKTLPANCDDPMRLQRDELGNRMGSDHQTATEGDLKDAESQLNALQNEIDSSRLERDTGQDLGLLIQVFRNFKMHSRVKALKSLKLDVVVYRDMHTRLPPEFGAPFRKIQAAATHTLSVACQALGISGLHVDHFDIFSATQYCSVPIPEITRLQECIPHTFGKLKVLSASVCNILLSPPSQITEVEALSLEDDPDDRDMLSLARKRKGQRIISLRKIIPLEEQKASLEDLDNFLGIPALLQHTTALEELDLHMYNANDRLASSDADDSVPGTRYGRPMVKHIANLPLPSSLHTITLRGFHIDFEDLLKLLRNIPKLQSVNLHYITLYTAPSNDQGWETIFTHLLKYSACLSNIYLDLLFDCTSPPNSRARHRYVPCFPMPGSAADARRQDAPYAHWQQNWPSAKGYNALHLRTREEVQQGFQWMFEMDFIRGSVQNSMWREERRRVYGPA